MDIVQCPNEKIKWSCQAANETVASWTYSQVNAAYEAMYETHEGRAIMATSILGVALQEYGNVLWYKVAGKHYKTKQVNIQGRIQRVFKLHTGEENLEFQII